jgi:hypothetical protein
MSVLVAIAAAAAASQDQTEICQSLFTDLHAAGNIPEQPNTTT